MISQNFARLAIVLILFSGSCAGGQEPLRQTVDGARMELVALHRQAAGGDVRAMYKLGRASGFVGKDESKQWLKKSAEQGYGPALFRLAQSEAPAVAMVAGRPIMPKASQGPSHKDRIKEAHEHLLAWAKDGDAESMYVLGSEFRTFESLGLSNSQNGIFWLRRATQAGHPEAPLDLAFALYGEGAGLSERQEGFELVKKQARGGNCIALQQICQAYVYGEPKIGLAMDRIKAKEWVDLLVRNCGDDAAAVYDVDGASSQESERNEEARPAVNPNNSKGRKHEKAGASEANK